MTTEIWTSASHQEGVQYEAWRHALNRSYLGWELDAAPGRAFVARTEQRSVDSVRFVDCRCEPCIGRRGPQEIRRGAESYFGFLFTLQGSEIIRHGDSEVVMQPGDIIMWDSERQIEFRVLEPLHKFSLLIPKHRMRGFIDEGEDYTGIVVSDSLSIHGIAAEALRRLSRDFASMQEAAATAAINPVLSLLSAMLQGARPTMEASPAHVDSLRRFKSYIELNLSDESLTPQKVADAHGTSLRYLHQVFAEQSASSVAQWIREKRLGHCYRELSQSGSKSTVTEVALRWGFNDLSHFSRTFKAKFGTSPKSVARSAGPLPVNDLNGEI